MIGPHGFSWWVPRDSRIGERGTPSLIAECLPWVFPSWFVCVVPLSPNSAAFASTVIPQCGSMTWPISPRGIACPFDRRAGFKQPPSTLLRGAKAAETRATLPRLAAGATGCGTATGHHTKH